MIKRYATAILLAIALIAHLAAAQSPQEKIDLEAIDKIKEEGLKRSRVMEILSYITDVSGPRLTGSPNFKVAAEWAKNKLAEWGLENARLEAWGPFGRGWSLESFTASMLEPYYSPLIAYPKAWSPSTDGTLRGEVVYLDAKTEADLEKYRGRLKGAIVLIAPPRQVKAHFEPEAVRLSDERLLAMANADPAPQFRPRELTPEQRASQQLMAKKWQLCFSEGAAVVLEPSREGDSRSGGDGGTIYVQSVTMPAPPDAPPDMRPRPWAKDAPQAIPQLVVAVEHYNRMIRILEKGGRVKLEIGIKSRFHEDDLMGYNVLAELPGTDLKDEIVMLGAHFDSWHSGTGATDNAAGSAVCLEAIRILKSLGIKPRRTIRIALWGGEEQGLLGSRAYVEKHLARRTQLNPPQFEFKPEYEKFSVYFNLDNGTGRIRGVYMQGNEAVRPIFRAWLAPFKDMGAATLTIQSTGGTDHLAFDAVGLPGFQFIQDPIEYGTRTHHSNMDVYERIQEEDLKQAAVIMASFVYNAAMRGEKLPRKSLPAQQPQPQPAR
jgi:hypothetical protein